MKPSSSPRREPKQSQRGVTLVIALIFLVVITLIVVSAIKSTNVNSKIAGNMQVQREAEAATQQAIEAVISSEFTKSPAPSR
jgi:Tfp pilus assembly protein PilX